MNKLLGKPVVFCSGFVTLLMMFVACFLGRLPGATSPVHAQNAPESPLASDDVSVLFPAPTLATDVISVADLGATSPTDSTKRDSVWSDSVFKRFLEIAASPAAQVAGTAFRIDLPPEAQSMAGWAIAGIRFDPGAPGLSTAIASQFGQLPQIRLIIQPFRKNPDGSIHPFDVAAHLIFSFTLGDDTPAQTGCAKRFIPDLVTFKNIVADVARLRTRLANGEFGNKTVLTANLSLGVHPGLADPATAAAFRAALTVLLERYLSSDRLNAMALMGLPANRPAPWMFLAMVRVARGVVPALPDGGFVPMPSPALDGTQFTQLLDPSGGLHPVPVSATNNLNPITCKNASMGPALLPASDRQGVSTAELFTIPRPTDARAQEVLDRIADPAAATFFNTDCVSCHTDTQRALALLQAKAIPGVDPTPPTSDWNVRNFGWSPGGKPSVTRRAAAETAAVVTFINAQMLGK